MKATPGLIPYPEPTDLVRNGASNMQGLASWLDKETLTMVRTTTGNPGTAVWADMSWTAAANRVGASVSSSSPPGITCAITGIYQVSGTVEYSLPAAPGGVRGVRVLVGGAASQALQSTTTAHGTIRTCVSCSGLVQVSAATTFGLQCYISEAGQSFTYAALSIALIARLSLT